MHAQIAPGLISTRYNLWTRNGPLVIETLTADLHEPALHAGAVLANDHVISGGETVTAMAARTGAVAGINGDFFDIGRTNQPLNLVIRNGLLLRTPSERATLLVSRNGGLRFGSYHISGTAVDGDRSWQLGAVNEWPPQGAAATLVTPAFGALPAANGVTVVKLEPLEQGSDGVAGRYRADTVDDATSPLPPRLGLAFGPVAIGASAIPDPGDLVNISIAGDPPLADTAQGIGGGPLLVAAGQPFADPAAPSPGEALLQQPQTGALRRANGNLVLVEVDGRQAARSVGLTRAEFGALLQALGAVDGMAFDGGGSATIVAREPGDAAATVVNVPSDGMARPVADGLFVYSDAPQGPAARLAVRPDRLDLLVGGSEALTLRATDAAGHPAQLPAGEATWSIDPPVLARIGRGGSLTGLHPGTGVLRAGRGGLTVTVPLTVAAIPARLLIEPQRPNPQPGGTVDFRADARDAAGNPLASGDAVRWTATAGTIDQNGRYTAGATDGDVIVRAGAGEQRLTVRVGRRTAVLPIFAPENAGRWTFATAPAGGPGNIAFGGAQVTLTYDFTAQTRAAYTRTAIALGGEPEALDIDVDADRRGVALRAAFRDAHGERVPVTLAQHLDWVGWRSLHVALPPSAVPPLKLTELYLVDTIGGAPVHVAGNVALRNVRVAFAGSTLPAPLFAFP